jgi:tetratricopeptide (TPR) repeat protein
VEIPVNPAGSLHSVGAVLDFIRARPWLNGGLQFALFALAVYFVFRLLMSERFPGFRERIPVLNIIYGRRQIRSLIKAGEYAQAGDRLVALGQLDQAIRVFEEGNLFGRAADIYLRRRQFERAAALYERAGEFGRAAEIFMDQKQYARAEAALDRAGRQDELPDWYRKRGELQLAANAHMKLGNLAQAAAVFEELRKPLQAADLLLKAHEAARKNEDPDFSGHRHSHTDELLLAAARLFEKGGEPKRAAQIYLQAGRNADAAACFAKGGDRKRAAEIYEQLGDLPKAASLYGDAGDRLAAVRAKAEHLFQSGDLKNAAVAFAEAGDFSRAAEIYQDLQELEAAAGMYLKAGDPGLAAALFRETGRIEEAGAAFETAEDWDNAADCFRKLGKADREAAIHEKAGNPIGMADALHRAARSDEALGVLEAVSDTDPLGRAARALAGRIHLDRGEPLRAKELFERALERLDRLRGEDVDTLYNLALVSEQTQSQTSAVQILERMLAQDLVEKDALQKAENVRRLLSERAFTKMSMVNATGTSGSLFAAGDAAQGAEATQPTRRRYTVTKEIGRGGMGVVFMATDNMLDRIVALKVLHSSFKKNDQAVSTFLREAKAAASLNHPNIVTVHDTGTQDGDYYIAMEYLEGKTIKQIVKARGKLSEASVREVLRQLLDGLSFAHSRKIVHRDLSNNNVMWTKQQTVKIMDFGLAKIVKELGSEQSIVGGTPSYMSPEQTLGDPIDHRTDIYSLGICLYEMLLGELPFRTGDLGFHHLHTPPPVPKEVDPRVPDVLNRVILKCMEKKPANRFQSVTEIQMLLKSGA